MKAITSEIVEVVGKRAAGALPAGTGPQGYRLAPGFYLVLWPMARPCRDAARQARYFGPFSERSVAERLKTGAAYLGIIAARETVVRTEASCAVAA